MFILERIDKPAYKPAGSCMIFGCRRTATHIVLDAEEIIFGWYCERDGVAKLEKLNSEAKR